MWPFAQPPNAATFTTTHIVVGGAAITRVYHDEVDGGWTFLSEHVNCAGDALIVALQEIVERDPSVVELADLPPGWLARRDAPGMPWRRELQYVDATQVVVDWSRVFSAADFFDIVLPQCGSPPWHGRNLNALADSWITGGIDQGGPPYAFRFDAMELTPEHLHSFRDAVLQIAVESIEHNGGRFLR